MTETQLHLNECVMIDDIFSLDAELPDIDNYNNDAHISNEIRLTAEHIRLAESQSEEIGRKSPYLNDEINKFIFGVRCFYKNIYGKQLMKPVENKYRNLLSDWNRFHQVTEDGQSTSVLKSSDFNNRISEFISWQRHNLDLELNDDNKKGIARCLQWWNMYILTRQVSYLCSVYFIWIYANITFCIVVKPEFFVNGNSPVSKFGAFLSAFGLLLYVVDMLTDVATATYYGYMGEWWKCALTLLLVYAAVTVSTIWKWINGELHRTGSLDRLQYFGLLLINWPDIQEYWKLVQLDCSLSMLPTTKAHLVTEWHQRRTNVARLKLTEGLWEASPQAFLQLCFLLPELNGDITCSVYLRIASTMLSMCTAGATLVNWQKFHRLNNDIALPMSELVMLHIWAVPVTVSRLLSVALLMTVNLYACLGYVALHTVLYSIYWCTTRRFPRTYNRVFTVCLDTLWYFISPFDESDAVPSLLMQHVTHFLCNTAMTAVWAYNAPLLCAHPILYIVIISFNNVIFVIGVLGWVLYQKYWL